MSDAMNSLESLVQNPSQIADIIKDPATHGLDFYNGLSGKQKQYVLLAAGIGLIIYGIYLGRQGDTLGRQGDTNQSSNA